MVSIHAGLRKKKKKGIGAHIIKVGCTKIKYPYIHNTALDLSVMLCLILRNASTFNSAAALPRVGSRKILKG